MKSKHEKPNETEAAGETDALRLSDLENEAVPVEALDESYAPDDDLWPAPRKVRRGLALVAVGAVLVAAAVIGGKIAYDRRKSARGYRRAVSALEDARDALLSAASELPERGREVLHRVTDR
ncbi:hypothetical protein [Glycomyces niveus]|uniref:Uncharacterized protein n=1 Tax=Glycomyces niveus TaxID=2820287 RepID=A0ABS3U642_9ACTN|nr:hypothetical protein [Glycomyces sp. NEAU-S30]MBO3733157.1 hypothetical protein [Glycomyces sp. NEAU-S30]